MKRLFTLIILLTAVATAAVAAKFTVIPPRGHVYEGQKFAVTFRLDNADGSGLKVSEINGCRLIYGPSTSTSRSYSVVNGRTEASSRVEYTYMYVAEKAGTFTIPPASIVADGKKLTTAATKFTVEPASAASQPASSRPVRVDDIDTQTSDRRVGADDVFVRIILSRPKVYEQEAIECTIKLYTKYSISEFITTRQPSFDGFLIQEIPLHQQTLNREETYNGQQYLTAVLKKCIIFPQKSGKLTINSGTYDISVVQYDNINMGGFLSVRQPRTRQISVKSNTGNVDVMPLPSPRPAGFTGAVGRFSIDSKLVGNKFLTNDPATLIYTITGTGNIKYVKEPDIDFPSEFEQYTPKADIQAEVSGATVSGKMTIEYTFVPQSVGEFKIGSDKFVYFDPSSRQYVTLTTPSYNIKVGKGAAAAASRDQEEISAKNTDIRHIMLGEKHLGHPGRPAVDSAWYWIVFVLPACALCGVIFANRRRIRLQADTRGRRLARAGKVARRRLADARKLMEANKSDEFYAETLRALTGYLSDKFAIPAGQFSREAIDEQLHAHGATPQTIRDTVSLLDRCEMARYTPGSAGSLADVYRQVADIINQIETLK